MHLASIYLLSPCHFMFQWVGTCIEAHKLLSLLMLLKYHAVDNYHFLDDIMMTHYGHSLSKVKKRLKGVSFPTN